MIRTSVGLDPAKSGRSIASPNLTLIPTLGLLAAKN